MKQIHKSSKHLGIALAAVVLISAVGIAVLHRSPARAATTQITGGTYGPNCNSGGYFTPASATITSGDTVTISVPANDPYPGGIEVHGFPEGNFVVLPGASHTIAALTANVGYYGTWPSTGCMKGTGTITVSAPAPPSPSNPPPSNPKPEPVSHTPSSAAPTATSPAQTTKNSNATVTKPKATSTPKSTAVTSAPAPPVSSPATKVALTPMRQNPTQHVALTAKLVGVTSAATAVILVGFLAWRLGWIRRLIRK